MLSKNNSKTLWIVLLVLLALFGILQFTGRKDSNMVTDLVSVDTAEVDQIVIYPPKGKPQISLKKSDNVWNVVSGKETHKADKRKVKSILGDMLRLKPVSVASTSEEDWKKYELTDSLATRVQLKKEGKVLSDVMIGKFAYIPSKNTQTSPYQRQPQGEMISYARPYDDENVYAVDGMIRMNFSNDPDNYRDKTFVNLQRDAIRQIDFNYPDGSSYSLKKDDKYWKINHEPADSATVVRYLRYLSHNSGSKIVHDFDKSTATEAGTVTVRSDGNNPVELSAYAVDSARYVVHSSQNKDTWFDGNTGKLYDRFFVKKDYFFKKAEKKEKKK